MLIPTNRFYDVERSTTLLVEDVPNGRSRWHRHCKEVRLKLLSFYDKVSTLELEKGLDNYVVHADSAALWVSNNGIQNWFSYVCILLYIYMWVVCIFKCVCGVCWVWCWESVVLRVCGIENVWCWGCVVLRVCGVESVWCWECGVESVWCWVCVVLRVWVCRVLCYCICFGVCAVSVESWFICC